MQNFKAVVFDIDGLMLDTGRIWLKGVKYINKNYGTKVPLKVIKEIIGLRDEVFNERLKEKLGQNFDVLEFRRLNKIFVEDYYERYGIKKKKGLTKLLKFLEKKKIPMVIASSSLKQKVELKFKTSELSKHYFKYIITGDMVKNSKPDPEIYLKACELLGFKPSEVLALEDSENGLLSAINAGCKTVCIPDIKKPSDEVLNKTFRQFKSLKEVINLFD